MNSYVANIKGISSESRSKKMANPVIHDFIVTLYVFNLVVSPAVRIHTMKELNELINSRCLKNREYFLGNENISSCYDFIKKVVDNFSTQSI